MRMFTSGLLVLILATVAGAEPVVELDLVMRDRVSPQEPQQWGRLLGEAGFSRPRIRSFRFGDELGIVTEGSTSRPVYRVTGYLLSNDKILLPPREQFGKRDLKRLSGWLSDLKQNGPGAAGQPKTAFGLTAKQLEAVNDDLSRPTASSIKGVRAAQAVTQLGDGLKYPLTIDAAARRALAVDDPVRDELKGLSAGTTIAAILRPAGCVLRPRVQGGKLEYLVVDARQKGDNWPIGWKSKKTPGQLIPQLFDKDDTQRVEVPLNAALSEISSRMRVPFLIDHNGMAVHRIEPDTKITMKAGKFHYGGILNDLLRQAGLRYETRVDENEKAFLWITTLKR